MCVPVYFPQWKFGLLSLGKSVVTVVLPNHVTALYWHNKIIEHNEMQHKCHCQVLLFVDMYTCMFFFHI